MPNELKRILLDTFREGYRETTSRVQKTKLIDDFMFATGGRYACRKYVSKILSGKITPNRLRKPGPRRKYGPEVINALRHLWLHMDKICSKRMVAALPLWLPFLKGFDSRIKGLLLEMSASTIDRHLKPYRKLRGLSTTRASMLKSSIPIKLLDGFVEEPGHIEADTVSHCGNSAAGTFISSLTAMDLFSGWTENRAAASKASEDMLPAIKSAQSKMPFDLRTWSSDNGVEFINNAVVKYLKSKEIEVIRRRPYKKNDAAHVEQKNWTHVRELFGYERFEDNELVLMMNEIYQAYWNPLQNLFMPMMKLKSKTRIGGRMTKKYDEPRTPYQRLMESEKLDQQQRKKLLSQMEGKNPFTLKKELEIRLKLFFQAVERRKCKLKEVA